MPLYEYECARCGRRFELLQKFSDPPTATCACGGAAHRQLSAPAVQFKGSGFYATDYARKSAPTDKTDGKPADSKAESKPEPASKSDEKKSSTATSTD